MLICPVSSPVYLASVYSPEVSLFPGAFIFCGKLHCLGWGGALFGAWWGWLDTLCITCGQFFFSGGGTVYVLVTGLFGLGLDCRESFGTP